MKLTKIGLYVFCVLTFAVDIHALPGDPDTTFDSDGITTAASGGIHDYGEWN